MSNCYFHMGAKVSLDLEVKAPITHLMNSQCQELVCTLVNKIKSFFLSRLLHFSTIKWYLFKIKVNR